MNNHPVILFDGVCNYCNAWVNFFIRHDRKAKLRFAALQSGTGKKLAARYGINEQALNSIVLIENGKAYTKSTAGWKCFRHLDGGWKLFYAFIVVPRFVRDFFYDLISRNRYRWWGRREACMVPDAKVTSRFLSD